MTHITTPILRTLILCPAIGISGLSYASTIHLPDLDPEQIAADAIRDYNPQTGREEIIAQDFDPFENIESVAGSVRLQTNSDAIAINGRQTSGGALVDVSVLYTSLSSDEWDRLGLERARLPSGESLNLISYTPQTLDCSSEMQTVTYDPGYYRGAYGGFFGSVYRTFPRYRGHGSFGWSNRGRWRGYGFRDSYRHRGFNPSRRAVHRSYARDRYRSDRRRDYGNRGHHTTRDYDYDRERRGDRSRAERRRDRFGDNTGTRRDTRRELGQRARDQRMRDQRTRDQGARDQRMRDGRGNRGGNGINADRERRAEGQERRRNRDDRIRDPRRLQGGIMTDARREGRANRERRASRDNRAERQVRQRPPSSDRQQGRAARQNEVRDALVNAQRRNQQSRPERRAQSERRARTERVVRPQQARPRAVQEGRRQRADRAARIRSQRAVQRRNPSNNILRDNPKFFPMTSGYTRYTTRTSSQCLKEEQITIHIPERHLNVTGDGLLILLTDNNGEDLPVYIPDNYIDGFKRAKRRSGVTYNR